MINSTIRQCDNAVITGNNFEKPSSRSKEPPYNIQSEIDRLQSHSITRTGLEFNLYTLFSEINRNAIGPEFKMFLGDHGRLQTTFSDDPLVEMYAAERQNNEIDKIRSPYDQKGIIMLEKAIVEYRLGNRDAFSWIMISPSLGIDSGFVMIEIGRLIGDKISPQLIAQRLSIPVNQFNQPEFEVLKKLANQVSGNKFGEIKHSYDILGEIIFRDQDEDLIQLVDSHLTDILGKKVFYGDSEKSFEEQSRKLQIIWNILKESGEVDKFLNLLEESAKLPFYDINKLIRARNSFINKFLDLKEIYEKYGCLPIEEIRTVLAKNDSVLTRDASGFCPGTSGDPKLEAMVRKYGYDKYGARVFVCPNCRTYVVRPVNELLAVCPKPKGCGLSVMCV